MVFLNNFKNQFLTKKAVNTIQGSSWKELSVISCQMCGNLGRVCIRAWVRWMGRSAVGKPCV